MIGFGKCCRTVNAILPSSCSFHRYLRLASIFCSCRRLKHNLPLPAFFFKSRSFCYRRRSDRLWGRHCWAVPLDSLFFPVYHFLQPFCLVLWPCLDLKVLQPEEHWGQLSHARLAREDEQDVIFPLAIMLVELVKCINPSAACFGTSGLERILQLL